jgi:hypothetical protein
MIPFHGGCHGCTQQYKHGTDFCFDCCYFQADWSKPNLNNEPSSLADLARQRVIDRRMKKNSIDPVSKPSMLTSFVRFIVNRNSEE